uniref:(northern house mosquito) hypothetical protein n=1 Tax=Culex pipiens TaxID=7175 RepID=A0A8D8MID7_CULPI
MQTERGRSGLPRDADRRHVRPAVDVSPVVRRSRPADVFPRDSQLGQLQGLDDQLAVGLLLQQLTVPMKWRRRSCDRSSMAVEGRTNLECGGVCLVEGECI